VLAAQETVPALGHKSVADPAVVPTCTETGLTEGSHCTVCQTVLSQQIEIPALGHAYVNYTCTRCGHSRASQGLSFTSLENGTCQVSGLGQCTDSLVIIPQLSPDGQRVVGIEANAFANCDSLVGLVLPEYITSIGEGAFRGCTSLKTVELGDGLAILSAGAFDGCTGLTSVTLGGNLFQICGSAAAGSDTLSGAFRNCSSLETLFIPSSVVLIGNGAFEGCTGLTIYCQRAEAPLGWESAWSGNCPVVWGVEKD
jgi:hypothetical protein